jgi:hypothetical protein
MSSEARPCQGFAKVAALWWRVCGPTISPRKRASRSLENYPGERLACGVLALS